MPQTAVIRPLVNPRYRTIAEPLLIDMLLLYGWAFECENGQEAAARAQCEAALESLRPLGLGFARGPAGARLFDPVEVLNLFTAAGLAGDCPVWRDRFVRTGRALVASLAESGQVPQRFDVKITRTLGVSAPPAANAGARITLPVPLACHYARDIATVLAAPPGLPATITRRDTCFDIRLNAPTPPQIAVSAKFTFTALPQPCLTAPLSEAERLLYLRPAEHLIRVTPRIARIAASLVPATAMPEKTVAAIWNFMLDHLLLGMVHHADIPADAAGDWVLEHRWCDCLLAAALFISLCRARHIPARLVGGHLLYPLRPTNHFWAECWLGDAWLPYDFLAWDLFAAGHDHAWRDVFAGSCDVRMVTEIFPGRFTGPMSLRLPRAWHLIHTRAGTGISCAYHDALTGAPIYRDRIGCKMLQAPALDSPAGFKAAPAVAGGP